MGGRVLQFRSSILSDLVSGAAGCCLYSFNFRGCFEPMNHNVSAGARFRAALSDERPLQVVGAINAYAARMAAACGFKALYLSGGGVAANSLGVPDLGISTMDDVLIDVRVSPMPARCPSWWMPIRGGAGHSILHAP